MANEFPDFERASRGLARLLEAQLERCGVAAPPIGALLWTTDRWQAEIRLTAPETARGVEVDGEEAEFGQAQHLIYRLLSWAAERLGGAVPEAVTRGFDDFQTAAPGAMLAYLDGWGAEGRDRRQAWTRAFELDPQFPAPRLGLARLLLAEGDARAAAGLLAGLPVADAAAAAELGIGLWAAGDMETSAALLHLAVAGDPADGVAAAALAALLARRGEGEAALDEAFYLATQATQLASDDYRSWAALGDVHRAQGQFDQAGFYYGFALRLAPEAATVLKDAGACRLLARQAEAALPLIARAIAAAPDDAENYGNLAFARDLLGEPEAALEAARRAAGLQGSDPRFLILQGDLALKAGRREEALEAWARATELDPGFLIHPEGGNIGLPEPVAAGETPPR